MVARHCILAGIADNFSLTTIGSWHVKKYISMLYKLVTVTGKQKLDLSLFCWKMLRIKHSVP